MEFINRTAHYNYFLGDKYQAGIKLTGTEIKSIRLGDCNLTDAYIGIRNNKVYIYNMYIGKYYNGSLFNHEERRTRELLLNKHEILKLAQKVKLEGVALIPTKAYFIGSLLKIDFSVCKGKNTRDKRETIKQRDLARENS